VALPLCANTGHAISVTINAGRVGDQDVIVSVSAQGSKRNMVRVMTDKTEGPEKRIKTARKLWEAGDKEDAALLIFSATAAVSRLRFPRESGYRDKRAFTEFLKEQIATITSGAMQAPLRFPKTTRLPGINTTENVPLEDVIYSCWRCVMTHEARWPPEVYLTPTKEESEYSTCIEFPPDGRLGLPEAWILGLADAVENAAEIVLPRIMKFPVFCVLPRIKVRNQDAIPIFTEESLMKGFVDHQKIADVTIEQLPDMNAFIKHGASSDRFVFNPVIGERPLPSYSMDTVLSSLGQYERGRPEPVT